MKGILEKLQQFWKDRSKAQRLQIIVASVLLVALIVAVSVLANQKEYEVLFSGMSESETSTIYAKLKDMSVDVKPRGTQTLLVPKGQADDLRLQLNEQGLPETGYNYDIFTNFNSFGATEADKQTILGFQLEQNIAQTLRRMEKIDDALVKVTLPKETQFALSEDRGQPALASVMLTIKGGKTLSDDEAEAIRDLVEKSVPQLQRENITITDSSMKVYRMADAGSTGSVNQQIDMQTKMQEILKEQVYNLLTPIFGPANISVAVNLILDFDKKVTNSVKYDPPTDADNMGIIISMREASEQNGGTANAGGNVGVDPNGGGTPTYPTNTADLNGSYYKQSKEFNAEVNETKEMIETAQGQIKSLAVSIILNGDQALESVVPSIRDATAKAIGVSQENISVVAMPFEYNNNLKTEYDKMQSEQQKSAEDAQKREQIIRLAMIGGIALFAILLIVFLASALRRKRKDEEPIPISIGSDGTVVYAGGIVGGGGIAGGVGADMMPGGIPVADLSPEQAFEKAFNKEDENSPLSQIQKMADQNPESIAQLLRNWLFDR